LAEIAHIETGLWSISERLYRGLEMTLYGTRDSLIEAIKSELKKNAIDPDFIDRRIDELYAVDGLSPPKLGDEDLRAAAGP
jgi:hypothetical protein